MSDWRIHIIRVFSIIQDLAVVYILSVPPFLIEGQLPPAGPQAASVFVAGMVFLLLRRYPKAAIPLSAASAFAAGLFLGLTWPHAAFLGAVAAWRIAAHAGSEPQQTEFFASFASITYGLAALFLIGMSDAGDQLLKILMIQFAVATAIRTARSVYGVPGDRKKQDRAFGLLAAGLFVLAFLVINLEGVLAVLGISSGWLLSGLGRMLGVLSYPLLGPLDGVLDWLDGKNEQMQEEFSETEGEVPLKEEFMYPAGDGVTEAGSLVLFLILGGFLVALVIYLFRSYSAGKADFRPVASSEIRSLEEGVRQKRKRNTLRNPVRREVQRLERKMDRKGNGRKPDQTFGDWLSALGVSGEGASILKDVYARVRYGEKPISRQEAQAFRKRIRKIGNEGSDTHE